MLRAKAQELQGQITYKNKEQPRLFTYSLAFGTIDSALNRLRLLFVRPYGEIFFVQMDHTNRPPGKRGKNDCGQKSL